MMHWLSFDMRIVEALQRDAYGPLVLEGLTRVYTWLGEKDLAIDELPKILSEPGYLTAAYLQREPVCDPLGHHPRFKALLARSSSPTAGDNS